jgi:hypothetical protein
MAWRGLERVHARTAVHTSFRVDPWRCRARSVPPWLSPKDVESIRRESGLLGPRYSLMTPGLAGRFAEGYERSAWVRRVVASRARYPDRVRVVLELREPVAAVPTEGGYVLVDVEGIRLPGVRQAVPAVPGRRVPLLSGVAAPPPEAGRVWSRRVREGAAVASVLDDLPADVARAVRVVSIDLENVGGAVDPVRPEVVLATAAGTVIEWGRSCASPRVGLEPYAEAKFEKLRRALRVYPGLRGLSRLKLQFDDLVVEEKDGPGHAAGG